MTKVVKKTKLKKNKCRMLLLVPLCLFVVVAVVVSIGSYWVQIAEKYQEKQDLQDEIIALKEKEEELKVDVERLEDPDYVARYARERFMYSKDGEILIRLPDEE